ncbi:DNA-processing protein DprA [Jeotgalibacillus sp. ET6]|uniref:DNA-processing protein DprA n=1 Tax=Jeotgalibacillus sp. ET6 TaxID=3037260 RepID=UPI002418BA51|nr:DNA-processing protein DprA [Jeotgalibacillus sp. ET6]MDG5470276.1 DNA-processing protein DprA [Jeotgalibacillus sp. ET6]
MNLTRSRLIYLHYSHILSNRQLLKWLREDSLISLKTDNLHSYPLSLNLTPKQKNSFQSYLSKQIIFDEHQLCMEKNLKILTILDDDYPERLKEIYDPPAVLYLKGNAEKLTLTETIGIVGSRKADSYTHLCLKKILPPLIDRNFCIISGMALGADGAAHTLSLEGHSIGVLGCGFDHIYPPSHMFLYSQMISKQLLITEYPPYLKPQKHFFPMRNRIISGLSKGILVTQAALKSGSLITVDRALEEGRDVFAVPGPIFHELSIGTNHLIKQGAAPVTEAADILNGWQIT